MCGITFFLNKRFPVVLTKTAFDKKVRHVFTGMSAKHRSKPTYFGRGVAYPPIYEPLTRHVYCTYRRDTTGHDGSRRVTTGHDGSRRVTTDCNSKRDSPQGNLCRFRPQKLFPKNVRTLQICLLKAPK
jgi:hypothetical protein